jgi:hypothetical protein
MKGLRGIGETMGMGSTMPDFVHGLNLLWVGDYLIDKPK